MSEELFQQETTYQLKLLTDVLSNCLLPVLDNTRTCNVSVTDDLYKQKEVDQMWKQRSKLLIKS